MCPTVRCRTESLQCRPFVHEYLFDEKIMFMKRLLKEVEYTQNYDLAFHEKMDSMITSLQESRYDRTTMAVSSRIDNYDIATLEVADELIRYVQKHPDYERYPLMEELVQDIRQKNSDVLMLRVDYDQSARLYNSFVMENKKYMSDIDSAHVQKLPLFAIE